MATFINLKCKKCGRKFKFTVGVLESDLKLVNEGSELPSGGKLPSKLEFESLAQIKTTERAYAFSNEIQSHFIKDKCDGEVVLDGFGTCH